MSAPNDIYKTRDANTVSHFNALFGFFKNSFLSPPKSNGTSQTQISGISQYVQKEITQLYTACT